MAQLPVLPKACNQEKSQTTTNPEHKDSTQTEREGERETHKVYNMLADRYTKEENVCVFVCLCMGGGCTLLWPTQATDEKNTHTHTHTVCHREERQKQLQQNSAVCLFFFTCSHLEKRSAQQNKAQRLFMSTDFFSATRAKQQQ